jgi:hypothetical protein
MVGGENSMRPLAAVLCLLCLVGLADTVSSQEPRQSARVEQQKLLLDEKRLEFERAKYNSERELAEKKYHSERELAEKKYRSDLELENNKLWATFLSVFVPIALAVIAYFVQACFRRREEASEFAARRSDETLQFQLKAAEILMNSRDAIQAHRKAQFLVLLFRDKLSQLEADFKKADLPHFGRTVEMREEFLKLFLQYPEARGDLREAWEILFPWDGNPQWQEQQKGPYRWLDKLKEKDSLAHNKLTGRQTEPAH